MKKNLLYCGFGWSSNIGNAFIDYGIQYVLSQCKDIYNIVFASNQSQTLKYKYSYDKKLSRCRFESNATKSFDLRIMIDADIYIFGGAMLSLKWFEINKEFIDYLIENNKKVVLLGVGGGNIYSLNEFHALKKRIQKLNLQIFISRDHETFEHFKDVCEFSYNGVDCSLYLNDVFKTVYVSNKQYDVLTFDHKKIPSELKKKQNVITLDHSSWNLGNINSFLKHPLKTLRLAQNNDLISDFPDDYLHVYANCNTTYSDRVHACMASLAFGNFAQYFKNSPRSNLFNRLNLNDIFFKPVKLEKEYLNNEKENMKQFFIKAINQIEKD